MRSGTLPLSFFLYYVICLLSFLDIGILTTVPVLSRDARASTDRRRMRRAGRYFCCCAVYVRDARASAPTDAARAVSPLRKNRAIYMCHFGRDRIRLRDNRERGAFTIFSQYCFIQSYYIIDYYLLIISHDARNYF